MPASDHVLDVAERLFMERGYAGTRLRDLANALGIKQASLYHHAPGGKAEIWRRVMDRALTRYRDRLVSEAAEAGGDLRSQLVAMAKWLVAQPPMNVVAVVADDHPDAAQPNTDGMPERLYDALQIPVADVIRQARTRNEVRDISPDLVAGMFIASVNGIGAAAASGSLPAPAAAVAEGVVDVLLDGCRKAVPAPMA